MRTHPENPFDMQKASHYTSEEILGHWVDIAEQHGGLVAVLEPRSVMPMFLLGGKGSGKTHLMRYCSAPVQAARHDGNLSEAIRQEQYVGIYVPAEALNTHKFSGKGFDDEVWATAFSTYFEAWLATSLLKTVRAAIGDRFDQPQGPAFARKLQDLLNIHEPFETLGEIEDFLILLRKRIDFIVSNSAITRDLSELTVPFSTGSLVFGLPDIVAETFVDLDNPLFVYLIDELENFTENQQRFLNTLIRYRKGRSTIKVGARLYGVKTYETLGSREPIRPNAEFARVELDDFVRQHQDEYHEFSIKLTLGRLERAGISTVKTREDLQDAFETIDRSNHWQALTAELMQTYDKTGRTRPYLQIFQEKLKKANVSDAVVDKVVAGLAVHDHPFLEKFNTFLFSRRLKSAASSLESLAKDIGKECAAFRSGKKSAESSRYREVLSHFGSDVLAQMFRQTKQREPYAGLDILVELSQGIPRNLLGILAHIYRRSLFAGEQPFAGGKISVDSQTDGVLEGGKDFRNEAQPDANAADVRDAVQGLALLFRSIRFSDAPSECDLCTFSVKLENLTPRAQSLLRTAENWSHLVQIEAGRKNKNHRAIDHKYQFSPMLAPLWGLSHHRRGSLELSSDLANAIFDPAYRNDLVSLVKSRVAGMNAPGMWASSATQANLF